MLSFRELEGLEGFKPEMQVSEKNCFSFIVEYLRRTILIRSKHLLGRTIIVILIYCVT